MTSGGGLEGAECCDWGLLGASRECGKDSPRHRVVRPQESVSSVGTE